MITLMKLVTLPCDDALSPRRPRLRENVVGVAPAPAVVEDDGALYPESLGPDRYSGYLALKARGILLQAEGDRDRPALLWSS